MEKVKRFFRNLKANLLQMFGSLCLLALAAAIGIYIGLNQTNNVDKYIKEAFEYFSDSNWNAMYSYAEVVDNDFINEYFYEKFVAAQYGEYAKEDWMLGDISVDGDRATAEFVSTKTGETQSWSMTFAKKYETDYAFFPQWRLDISDSIIESCTVTSPVGFEVYVDGVQLSPENSHISEYEDYVIYEIPRLFKGEHNIFLESEDYQLVETFVLWNKDEQSYKLDTTSLVIKEADEAAIKSDAKSIVMGMYSAIFSEAGVGNISQYFLTDDDTKAMYQTIYDQMLAAIKPADGSTLNSMEITTYNQELTYTYGEGMDVKVTFECTFKARGKRSNVGGVRTSYEGTSSSEVIMHFTKIDDVWYCDTLDMECIDYSKK